MLEHINYLINVKDYVIKKYCKLLFALNRENI